MLTNRSIPNSTVIPVIAYPSVPEAVNWLCGTFGFTLRISMGSHRAQLSVGDGAVVVRELDIIAEPKSLAGDFYSIIIRVANIDQHYAKAFGRGASIVSEPTTFPYGERQYTCRDFAGHLWTFSESIFDAKPEEWGGEAGML